MQETPVSPASDRVFAALVSLGYLFGGLVWIGLSDRAGGLLFSSAEALTRFQTWKGVGFVVVSTLMVFLLAARGSRHVPVRPGARTRFGLSALLAGLVLVTAVPLVATLGYNVLRQTSVSAHEAETLVQGFAHATSARLQAYLEDRHRIARRLAGPAAGGDANADPDADAAEAGRACDPSWSQALGLLDDVRDALLLDRDGKVVCAARGSAGVPVTAAQLRGGVLLTVPEAGGPPDLVALTQVVEGARDIGSVQLLLAHSRLQRVAAGSAASGVSITLLTDEGRVLAHAPEGSGAPPVPGELAALARDARAGVASRIARDADGRERLHGLRPVAGINLLVAASVDTEETIAPVRRQALRSVGAAAAVVLLAGLLLAVIVRRITGPMKALAQTAQAVAGGDLARRAPEAGPPEVAGVAVQFNRMLDRLPAVERQLRESEERHRTLLQNLSHNIPGMIFQLCLEPDGHSWLPFASEACERMLELTAEELRADGALFARFHPDDLPMVQEALRRSCRDLSRLYRGIL